MIKLINEKMELGTLFSFFFFVYNLTISKNKILDNVLIFSQNFSKTEFLYCY